MNKSLVCTAAAVTLMFAGTGVFAQTPSAGGVGGTPAAGAAAPGRGPAPRPPSSEATTPTALQSFMVPPDNTESRAPRPMRARAVPLALAVQAAQTTIATCKTGGADVTVVVIDSQGIPTLMLAGENAATVTQRIAMGKAYTAWKSQMSSGDAVTKAGTDTTFAAKMSADPLVGPFRAGGFPIKVGNDIIGAIGVSGSPTAKQDEVCAQAGIGAIQSQLH